MSTARAERRLTGHRRRTPHAAALLVVALVAAGCSSGVDDAAPPTSSDAAPNKGGSTGKAQRDDGVAVPADLARGFRRTLAARAAAVLAGDREGFIRGIERADGEFAAQQTTYFDNLTQLPLQRYGYRLDPAGLVRAGDDYWAVVDVVQQLEGYDDAPVRTRDRFRFSPVRGGDRFVLSSVTDQAWERENGVRPQPWDLGPVEVREGVGVLGVFDSGSAASAEPLMRSFELGLDDVAAAVPLGWSRRVVFYALSDTTFLRTLPDLPGGEPARQDGVAFPVEAGPEGKRVVGTRVALHPRIVGRVGPEVDRLVRHELTHVAVGTRADGAPLWLSEGIAEYISAQPMAPEERTLAEEALAAAQSGVNALPEDRSFEGTDSAASYGLSWWACEYLAEDFGSASLWTLLDEVDDRGVDVDDTTNGLFGLTSARLARRGAKLMIDTYAPEPPERDRRDRRDRRDKREDREKRGVPGGGVTEQRPGDRG